MLDGVQAASIRADGSAKFEVTLSKVVAGARTIGLYSTDSNGRKSININFNVAINTGATITLTDVVLPPTIDISAIQLNKGEVLRIFGQAQPQSSVNVHVQSEETITKTITDNTGAYAIRFDTNKLAEDEHITKSSPFSKVLQFIVGRGIKQLKTGDLNKDGKVNIIDFSILLFWWGTNQQKGLDVADINGDKKINIIDFSIMLFQWTG